MSTQVTIQMVKELRERTGVGMSKCKEALTESKGNLEDAVDHLRKAGIASAVKKEGREANEGAVVSKESDNTIAVVEISAETDFVVKNDKFQEFASNVALDVAKTKPADVSAFSDQPYSQDPSMTVNEFRATVVQSLGENIQIKRIHTTSKEENTSYGVYSHMAGKILSLVVISGSSDEDALAKGIAMHIAAEAPEYLDAEDVPEAAKAREMDIAKTQALNSGKPESIVDKIVEGKLRSFYDQVCLLRQKYVKDSDLTIAQLVAKHAKESGKPLALKSFIRWKVGQK
ncbi:MAG: elongation factor Ts [Chlamydiales bacterium]|jgi:elongation factor Ts